MNKFLHKIYRWRQNLSTLSADGNLPAFIPVTREEIEITRDEYHSEVGYRTGNWSRPEIFGAPTFETAHAVAMRERMLHMPLCPITETAVYHPLDVTFRKEIEHATQRMRLRLETYVCSDKTSLDIRMEWDPLARLKRFLRITKWFPIRHRTVRVDGRVLYPYLTVNLPHNRHHVQFAVHQ